MSESIINKFIVRGRISKPWEMPDEKTGEMRAGTKVGVGAREVSVSLRPEHASQMREGEIWEFEGRASVGSDYNTKAPKLSMADVERVSFVSDGEAAETKFEGRPAGSGRSKAAAKASS